MAALAVVLREDVEKERLHVVVQGLVVQEQLGQQAQVLTVDCAHISVHLVGRENRHQLTTHGKSGNPKGEKGF